MNPSRRIFAIAAGALAAVALGAGIAFAATGDDQIMCEPGVPIVLSPDHTWACTPTPEPSTVTVTTPVPTTVTEAVVVPTTVTVTASPSPSQIPSAPTESPYPEVHPSISTVDTSLPPTTPTPTPSASPTATTAGCPAFPAMPDEKCTGYAHTGVTLRDCTQLRITAPNTVIDGCRFRGTVVIAAGGVTIKRSLIQGGHVEGSSGADLRGLVLEDVQIIGAGNDGSAAVGNNNYTCRRCDISGGLRGFAIGSNVVIEDSYAHHFWVQSSAQRASNSVHQTAASTHGGAHIRITHSTLWCQSDAYACSSGVSLYSEDAPGIDDVLIEKSFLATDAGFGIMFASKVAGKPYGITNTRVIGNVFGPSEYGPVANFPSSQAGNVWSGNATALGRTVPAA